MIKFVSSVLIVTSSFILAFGQTPQPGGEREKTPQAFSFHFDGDGGYLGVQTQEVTKENFGKFGLREVRGVAVERVMENSPAAAAGIKEGDVIVRFNGDVVTSSRKLTRLVGEVDPDHQVRLTISRNGSEQEITATVGKRPMARFGDGNFTFDLPQGRIQMPELQEKFKGLEKLKGWSKDGPQVFQFPGGQGESFVWRSGSGRQIGVSVYNVTKQLGERYGVDGGVMINEVRPDSPGAKAGLKAGDIIIEVDGKPVRNNFDLIKAVNAKTSGDVQLTIMRDRNRQTISVTPEISKDGGFFFKNGDNDNGLMFPRMPPDAPMVARPAVPAPHSTPAPGIAPAMRLMRPARVI